MKINDALKFQHTASPYQKKKMDGKIHSKAKSFFFPSSLQLLYGGILYTQNVQSQLCQH